jgi:mRNA-degrading endonuclease YafQ of YafQ-DinJ toxin-antitoxin module
MSNNNGHEDIATIGEKITQEEIDAALKAVRDNLHEGASDSWMDNTQKLGVLQTLIHAQLTDEQYRNALLLGSFKDEKEAKLCADAIAERRRFGASIESIVDKVYAQCAAGGHRAANVLDALTHYRLSTNYQNYAKKQKQDKGSPLNG